MRGGPSSEPPQAYAQKSQTYVRAAAPLPRANAPHSPAEGVIHNSGQMGDHPSYRHTVRTIDHPIHTLIVLSPPYVGHTYNYAATLPHHPDPSRQPADTQLFERIIKPYVQVYCFKQGKDHIVG
jgi:hypothetical protein